MRMHKTVHSHKDAHLRPGDHNIMEESSENPKLTIPRLPSKAATTSKQKKSPGTKLADRHLRDHRRIYLGAAFQRWRDLRLLKGLKADPELPMYLLDRSRMKEVSSNKCAGGFQKVFEHESSELKCKMKFAVFLPPKAESEKCPVLYWLSGLTCTEQNFITKAGSQLAAAEHGLIVVAPDTSPRGCNIEGEDENWDFGTGAGFYVDATEEPWKNNYRMYSYITDELPRLINGNFPTDPERMSVSGHSMGGHGALICALKNPGKYKSVSAFAPICNPVQCPWGQKAFTGYLGSERSSWEAYDATVLASSYSGPRLDVLIDQGKDDQFLSASQLLPDNLITVCSEKKIPVVFRLQPGYDHSYFFIYSFINDHIKHHAKFLNA